MQRKKEIKGCDAWVTHFSGSLLCIDSSFAFVAQISHGLTALNIKTLAQTNTFGLTRHFVCIYLNKTFYYKKNDYLHTTIHISYHGLKRDGRATYCSSSKNTALNKNYAHWSSILKFPAFLKKIH